MQTALLCRNNSNLLEAVVNLFFLVQVAERTNAPLVSTVESLDGQCKHSRRHYVTRHINTTQSTAVVCLEHGILYDTGTYVYAQEGGTRNCPKHISFWVQSETSCFLIGNNTAHISRLTKRGDPWSCKCDRYSIKKM